VCGADHAEVDDDPQHMREVARRFREIALDHERDGNHQIAKKMRRAAVDNEVAAGAIERAKGMSGRK